MQTTNRKLNILKTATKDLKKTKDKGKIKKKKSLTAHSCKSFKKILKRKKICIFALLNYIYDK